MKSYRPRASSSISPKTRLREEINGLGDSANNSMPARAGYDEACHD